MANLKKGGALNNEHNLKRNDSKKNRTDSSSGILMGASFGSNKKLPDSMVDTDITNVKVKKRLPIVVDIIAGILLFLIVIGVVVASYFLFRMYSNDYDNKSVTYDIIVTAKDEIDEYKKLVKQDVYIDTTDNSVYYGKIVNVSWLEGETDRVLIRITATAKYREGEGYFIGDRRLAVGSEFVSPLKLRCGERSLGNASVVKLTVNGGN